MTYEGSDPRSSIAVWEPSIMAGVVPAGADPFFVLGLDSSLCNQDVVRKLSRVR